MNLQPSDPDIQTIVSRIRSGDLDLQPDFQRGEVWSTAKKRKLIDSVLRNWHIPPIHVVVTPSGRQEVLDGQQRLAAIRDFVEDQFTVNGEIEPVDARISELNGLRYSALPSEWRRVFDQFTIRVFRLTDYRPEEPGELFFRLNQITSLTPAEQRNAFYGPARDQVRALVDQLEKNNAEELFKLNNKRMAFDDVIAKVLCSFDEGNLSSKITASDISSRFRSADGFRNDSIARARSAIELLCGSVSKQSVTLSFNKGTLFSWIIFSSLLLRNSSEAERADVEKTFARFVSSFEERRTNNSLLSVLENLGAEKHHTTLERELAIIYVDRSTSRVSDISSVILRDFTLWWFYHEDCKYDLQARSWIPENRKEFLGKIQIKFNEWKGEDLVDVIEGQLSNKAWGIL